MKNKRMKVRAPYMINQTVVQSRTSMKYDSMPGHYEILILIGIDLTNGP